MTLLCCVWKILRAHWRMTLNRLRYANKIIRICYVVFGVVVLGLAVGGGVAAWQLCGLTLRSWLELQMVLPFDSSDIHLHIFVLINNLQEMLLVWIFVLVLPASFSFLLVNLYLSEESELLIAYPVPSWAVFIFQIVDFVAGFLLFPASLVISMLWGAGAAKGYGLGYYVLVLLAMLLQVLLGVGLGVLLLQIVVRVVSPRWVTRGLAVFAIGIILAGYLCYAVDLSLSTVDIDWMRILAPLGYLTDVLSEPYSPASWPSAGLDAVSQGKPVEGLALLAAAGGVAAGLFIFSFCLVEHFYGADWDRARSGRVHRKRRVVRRRWCGRSLLRLFPPSVGGMMEKDFRTLIRDPTILPQLIIALVLTLIYSAAIFVGSDAKVAGAEPGSTETGFYLMLLSVLVGPSMILGELALLSVAWEGKRYWIVKSAPVSTSDFVLAKWIVGFLPSTIVCWLTWIGIALIQGMTLAQFIFGFALLGFGTAATTGLCIALGIVGVRHEVSEYSLLSVGMSLLASLVAFMCQWSVGMLFSLPAILMQRLGYPELPALAMSLILSGGVSLAVAYLVPRWVLGQVSLIGEDDSDVASGERRDVDHFVSGLTD